ncbi:MmoB/DmpM family protein [Halarcobacter anaerophilus]|uniref:Monooxygenase n=1 Tax=Halarcobacter anaerophilus TaxID=877500 RepID=A0A4Q0XWN1_9BACT|nr:MmoB/DmpM family protein [Halarcobacter anaerophilus]QDF28731.1 phenol hydroxylase, regulatory component P2 [Halarcobacter anaerophilus]RXJ61902.1 monooxygenase [Halarcobacter anaerophilus]
MSKSIALLCIQATDEGRTIAEAIKVDNEGIQITNKPAMIQIEREGEIVIKADTVSDALGRDWEPEELQLILISTGGQIDEDDEQFVVYWNN